MLARRGGEHHIKVQTPRRRCRVTPGRWRFLAFTPMVEDTHNGSPQWSAAALHEWAVHVDSVLRGISHSLNNRAAAISAILELSRDPDDRGSATMILATELDRVRELAIVVRLIGTAAGGSEAFEPGDAATAALAILSLHAGQRDRAINIDASSAPPTRVPRWMFVRALVTLAASVSNATPSAKSPVTVALSGEGDWLVARAGGTTVSAAASPYTAELARAMGGELLENPPGFRVPTLAALRRREAL